MSKRRRQYGPDDDPIDWSGFSKRADAELEPVEGSAPLAILSGAMIVAGIVALIWGLNAFGAEALEFLNSGKLEDGTPLALAVIGALSIIPGIFGLQVASKPVGFVAPTVLGVAGVFIAIVMLGLSLIMQWSALWPWIVCLVIALVYILLVVRVHKAANEIRARAMRGAYSKPSRSKKDELWDEKNIWK